MVSTFRRLGNRFVLVTASARVFPTWIEGVQMRILVACCAVTLYPMNLRSQGLAAALLASFTVSLSRFARKFLTPATIRCPAR